MLKIVCIGKLKEKFYRETEEEYKKRINKFIRIEIQEVDKFDYNSCDYKIYLDEDGREMNSKEFSKFLNGLILKHKNVCFFYWWLGRD